MRVLLLSSGGPVGIGTTRSLQSAGHYVIGTDCREEGRLLSVADEVHELPHAGDPKEGNEAYAKALFKLCWDLKPNLVHAQSDEEVRALSRYRSALPFNRQRAAYYMLPSHDTVCVCQDKWLSFKRWNKKVPVPDTYLIRGREAIFNFLAKYGEGWIRRRQGGGAKDSLRTSNLDMAREWMNLTNGWGKFTIAQVLEGPSVTVQTLWNKGTLVGSQQRGRLSWTAKGISGVGGSTASGETLNDSKLQEAAVNACLAIDPEPHGLFGVDLTMHNGTAYPTEINVGRFFTTIDFFTKAGFNFPDLYARVATGGYYEPMLNPIPAGRKWIRTMDREPVLV